jgi:hypothetical protein
VSLLTSNAAWAQLGLSRSNEASVVGYETRNTLINAGSDPWTKETGLLSIWILGMFNPSPSTTIVVPIQRGTETQLGPQLTSDYFGSIPPQRLKVTDAAIYFSGDGLFRSKIGINPRRSLGVLGSYDAAHHILTIVQFDRPHGMTDYVNSLWKLQNNPFAGDVANAYNDGPASPGAKPLGPFYELESSSPAAALAPTARIQHVHRTFHIAGPDRVLDHVARKTLGVSLSDIQAALAETAAVGGVH